MHILCIYTVTFGFEIYTNTALKNSGASQLFDNKKNEFFVIFQMLCSFSSSVLLMISFSTEEISSEFSRQPAVLPFAFISIITQNERYSRILTEISKFVEVTRHQSVGKKRFSTRGVKSGAVLKI